ncbi:MAG: hypothetical protein F6K65_31340 [Moorea sp. SIO3C2]|nr:hypothetical protein [Moorena sp. SIO3C2]
MKPVFRVLTLLLTIIMSLTGIEGETRTIAYRSREIAQRSATANKKQLITLVVPSSAIVRFKQGGSYTGELTAFNSQNLRIAANGSSEIVSLSQISQVEFPGDLWIFTPEETRKRVPIRGITIPLEAVPVMGFNLEDPPYTATLNLETVLSHEEFERLSGQTNRIYVVKEILFESTKTMTIKIVRARR